MICDETDTAFTTLCPDYAHAQGGGETLLVGCEPGRVALGRCMQGERRGEMMQETANRAVRDSAEEARVTGVTHQRQRSFVFPETTSHSLPAMNALTTRYTCRA